MREYFRAFLTLYRAQTVWVHSRKLLLSSKAFLMEQYVARHFYVFTNPDDFQIALEDTTLDAAKSSIVYGVTKSVSTAGRAVSLHSSYVPFTLILLARLLHLSQIRL